jgi:hypothetical protein
MNRTNSVAIDINHKIYIEVAVFHRGTTKTNNKINIGHIEDAM